MKNIQKFVKKAKRVLTHIKGSEATYWVEKVEENTPVDDGNDCSEQFEEMQDNGHE